MNWDDLRLVAALARAGSLTRSAGVLAGEYDNGFGNRSLEVAATLPWTSGSLVSAARHVARHGGVAVSPTSGFHHARHRSAGGFCTFNGLMVAVRVLQLEGLARKVGILDIDSGSGWRWRGTWPAATRATRRGRSSRCCGSTTRRWRSATRPIRGADRRAG